MIPTIPVSRLVQEESVVTFDEAVTRLRQAGLVVEVAGASILIAAKPEVSSEAGTVVVSAVHAATARIFQDRGVWLYEDVEVVPQVNFKANSLDHAVEVATRRFLGRPLVRGGWAFPVHRHPDWDASKIEQSLAKARNVNSQEWQTIRAAYDQQRRGISLTEEGGLAKWLAVTFRPIPSVAQRSETLWMRRDLLEMYIVSPGTEVLESR